MRRYRICGQSKRLQVRHMRNLKPDQTRARSARATSIARREQRRLAVTS